MYPLATLFPWVRKIRIPLSRDQVMVLLLALNFLLLTIETYLAHLVSGTIVPREWIPILFSPVFGIILLAAGILSIKRREAAVVIASIVFVSSMVVGALGAYYHLLRGILPGAPVGQQFSLPLFIWAPPILAPMVYILIGFLGIISVWPEDPVDSGRLLLPGGKTLQLPLSKTRAYFFLATIGCLSTVVSSVLDHSRTDFSNPWLWMPNIVGLFAAVVAFLLALYKNPSQGDLAVYLGAMLLMIVTGVVGLVLHVQSDLTSQGELIFERVIKGAPFMAPMLFSDIGTIGLIVLLDPKEPAKKQ